MGQESFVSSGSIRNEGPNKYYLLVDLILSILFSISAAMLSYNYNTYYGATMFMKIFWAILAFLFSKVYIIMYAMLLNPINTLPKAPAPAPAVQAGGKGYKLF
jgi:hypothetical protein